MAQRLEGWWRKAKALMCRSSSRHFLERSPPERSIPRARQWFAAFSLRSAYQRARPRPDISTPAAVKKALLEAKMIGYEDPDFTVAGQGPWEALTKLGIADQVATKSQVELGPGAQGISPAATNIAVKTSKRLENGAIDICLLMLC